MRKNKSVKTKVVLISIAAVLLAAVVATVCLCYFKTTIASGVSICGIDVGGMEKSEAKSEISAKTAELDADRDLIVTCNSEKVIFDCNLITPSVNLDASVEEAYKIGKTGSPFSRLGELLYAGIFGEDLEFELSLNYEELNRQLEPVIASIPGGAVPTEYKLSEDGITVIPGTEGNLPDYDSFYSELSKILFGRKSGNTIKLEVVKASHKDLTAEAIYKKFGSEVKNAEYSKGEDGKVVVIPSSDGVDFDIKEAQKILDKSKDEKCVIPIEFEKAEITTEDLSEKLYADELSSYYSNYAVGNTGRNTNLELACSKMDGVELMPGEVFSYVGVVGQGTYEEGYVDAAVYSGGEVTTGVAGGICQGSSTLYSAVLFADLEVVQRVNHSMPVGYVPRGMDATIATPHIDFQFKNSTGYPLKISSTCSGGTVDIRLLGTNETPEKEVEISNILISTKPFETEEKENSELKEGEEIIKQNGSDGCVIETYKTIKINGVEQSTTLVSTSRYNPIPQIVEIPPKDEDEKDKDKEKEDSEKTEDEKPLDEAVSEETPTEVPKTEDIPSEPTDSEAPEINDIVVE